MSQPPAIPPSAPPQSGRLASQPVWAMSNPRARRNPPVGSLPIANIVRRQEVIRIDVDLRDNVDHACRSDEPTRGDRAAAVVGKILSRDPVDRRVEVRPGVLPHPDGVPVPSRTFVIEP